VPRNQTNHFGQLSNRPKKKLDIEGSILARDCRSPSEQGDDGPTKLLFFDWGSILLVKHHGRLRSIDGTLVIDWKAELSIAPFCRAAEPNLWLPARLPPYLSPIALPSICSKRGQGAWGSPFIATAAEKWAANSKVAVLTSRVRLGM
jgi:hypothetical protein